MKTVLSEIGNRALLERKLVSVVGTRTPQPASEALAGEVASVLRSHGYVTVSGLALGIDTVVHRASFPATVAVLPTPPERTYPAQNAGLRLEIENGGGLVVSQFPAGTETRRWHFLQRDKLMAELSVATVVVEEKPGGGAMWQAEYALAAGKTVILLEPPDSHPEFRGRADVFFARTAEETVSIIEKIPVQGELF